MSRGAEDNFDLGMRVNIDSIRLMLEAARHSGAISASVPIKFIFTSSLAVYGGQLVSIGPYFRALETDVVVSASHYCSGDNCDS